MAGELDVDAMLRRTPAKVFRRWEMYDSIQPFGDYREDLRTASIVQMIFNMAVAVKDRKELTEFLLPWSRPKEKAEEDLSKLPMINGVPITEQIWIAMNVAAMNSAGAFDPSKVLVEEAKS